MSEQKIIECVPNFSEGRDNTIIQAIAAAISGVNGVTLLDVDPGYDTNRTVYTFVGDPESVVEAAVNSATVAYELIDMRNQTGAHPRMGALDVCPFVPVSGVTMDECVAISKKAAERIASTLSVPIYLYEYAASTPNRKSLADIRAGEYEALDEKLRKPEWKPDYGPAKFVPKWGATVVGARDFLVAYNVNLNTKDKKLANDVALSVREAGKAARDANGNIIKDANGKNVMKPGRLKFVRAIGWYIEEYRKAQVSINLTNYKETALHTVYETVKEEAEKIGLAVCGSELVGLVPLAPLVEAGRYYMERMGKSIGASEQELVELAITSMGLDSIAAFDPSKKIIEYASRAKAPLASMTVTAFCDEVSSDSPAPGGGSVSALAGSLAAALAAMVANLTVGKKGYETHWKSLSGMAVKAQALKALLLRYVDDDTKAFSSVMDAMKLPKANDEEKAIRDKAIQDGYKAAISVPLNTANACISAIELAIEALSGNKNSASDAGVAALMARAGAHGAALNIITNLGAITDAEYSKAMRQTALTIRSKADDLCAKAINLAEALMN